jgi:DNA primase
MHEAKPLVTRIGAPLLRLQVIKMLAETAGFTQAEVEQSFGLKNASAQPRRFDDAPPFEGNFERGGFDRDFGGASRNVATFAASAGKAPFPSHAPPGAANPPSKPCSSWSIQHPLWAARLPIDLLPHDTPEGRALIALTDAMSIGELPTHGIGALLEHYRETPHAEILARMAGLLADTPFEDASLEPLFNDTVNKLEVRRCQPRDRRPERPRARKRPESHERRQLAELMYCTNRSSGHAPKHQIRNIIFGFAKFACRDAPQRDNR